MLSVALSCRFSTQNLRNTTNKKHNIFSPKREKEKRAKGEKKDMQVQSNGAAAVKVFWKNTTRSVAEVWRFFQKPGGLDLYCR
jgi:hypothetical protein